MKNVSVVNHNDEAWTGRHNGVAYAFEPGKAVTIPEFAAMFLFGYGMGDEQRHRALIRNGWLKTSDPKDEHGPVAADKFMKKFRFKQAADDVIEKPKPKTLDVARVVTNGKPGGEGEGASSAGDPQGTPPGGPPLLDKIPRLGGGAAATR